MLGNAQIAEAIAALVAALANLLALLGELIAWVVMALAELVVALWMRRAYTKPKLRRWRKLVKGDQGA